MDKFKALAVCINTSRIQLQDKIITREELVNYLTVSDNSFISNLIKHHVIFKLGKNQYQFSNKPIHIDMIRNCMKSQKMPYKQCSLYENGILLC